MSTISVCIGNYGYYNEGRLHDAWIDLPVDPATIRPWLIEHGLWDRHHEETYISDYDGIPLGCSYGNVFSEYTSLDSLNILAQLIEDHPDDSETVKLFIETSGDEPDSILALCNYILQANELPLYGYDVPEWCEGDSPEEKLAYSIAQYTDWWDKLCAYGLQDYFNLEAYGESLSMNCALGDTCYVDQIQNYPREDFYSWPEIEAMMPWHVDSE